MPKNLKKIKKLIDDVRRAGEGLLVAAQAHRQEPRPETLERRREALGRFAAAIRGLSPIDGEAARKLWDLYCEQAGLPSRRRGDDGVAMFGHLPHAQLHAVCPN